MEKRMIKVMGTQRDLKGEENIIELTTEGKVYEKNNHIYIVYEETEISGMEGATTTLKIEGDNKVSMKRYGAADSQIVFEEGKRFTSQYKTMFGDFRMDVKTSALKMDLSPENQRGKIEIAYDVVISGLTETKIRLGMMGIY